MTPGIVRSTQVILEAAPPEWLASHRDPTLSLAPLSHFLMDSAPTGSVELMTTPYRGASILPEEMAEIELEMTLAELGERGDQEVGDVPGQPLTWVPRRVLPTVAKSSSAQPRKQARVATTRRAPMVDSKQFDDVAPIVRESDHLGAEDSNDPATAVSGKWSAQGRWVPMTAAVRASGWTRSLMRTSPRLDSADLPNGFPPSRAELSAGGFGGAERLEQNQRGEPTSSSGPLPAVSPPISQMPVVGSPDVTSSHPGPGDVRSELRAASEQSRPQPSRAPSSMNPTAQPATNAGDPARPAESSERGLLGAMTDQGAGSLNRGLKNSSGPESGGISDNAAPQEGVARVSGGDASSTSGNVQLAKGVPRRRLGLGEPMRHLPTAVSPEVPPLANEATNSQEAKREGVELPLRSGELSGLLRPSVERQMGEVKTPPSLQAAKVVYAKSALGEMKVRRQASNYSVPHRSDRPIEVSPIRSGAQAALDLDGFATSSRALVANRSMVPFPSSPRTSENSSFDAPGLGEVSLKRDAMADDRLTQARALGLAKGKEIDLSAQLGNLSNPRALGVFAHELTHLYQQQAMSGSRMPMAGTPEFRALEEQAESVRHSVETSPMSLVAAGGRGGGLPFSGSAAPGQRASGSAVPPRALAVARLASATVSRPPGQQISSSRDSAGTSGGERMSSGPINTRPRAQTVYSPVAGTMAAAGGGASGGGVAGGAGAASSGDAQPFIGQLKSFSKKSPAGSDGKKDAPVKDRGFSEGEINFLYRELLHRIKNQLRWEADRTGNLNRFFRD